MFIARKSYSENNETYVIRSIGADIGGIDMDRLLIGTVAKPHGIRGEVRLHLSCGFGGIARLKEVYVGDVLYRVQRMRPDGDVILLLQGISDRNAAETLRGQEVFADRNLIEREDGEYFICDLEGSKLLLSDGTCVGTIERVITSKASKVDIFYIDGADGKIYLPFLKKLNATLDEMNNTVTVDKEAFEAEATYED